MNTQNDPPDPSLYARPPQMNLETGIALARALVQACPQNAPNLIKKRAKKLDAASNQAQNALAKRQHALGQISQEDSRIIDQEGDNSWSALRSRLHGFSLLRPAEFPDASRASQLLIQLFGEAGLSFVKESYPVQWTTADTILKRIDEDQLAPDIDRIAGPEFLAHIRKRHAEYGDMVKRLLNKNSGDSVNLSKELRGLGQAMVGYALQVCTAVDGDNDDPEMIAMAKDALRPWDVYREDAASRSANSAKPDEAPQSPSAGAPEVK